ncbi:hypothetical protein [uncultured Tenacibaculum sp.]|uniref:hypothetical protein n=2 Tax=Tenacibaculum TaxID=104267 RepID=UPI0026126299|nr:hypothetical protein [uncultured Tenacibaculum sp.]
MLEIEFMDSFDKIAQQYVKSLDEVSSGFKFTYSDRKEFVFKIYYNFVLVDLQGNIPKKSPVIGGASGFIIDKKTKEVESISFIDLRFLEEKQNELQDIYKKISNIKESTSSFLWLKSKYNINSTKLLKIKKMINKTNSKKQEVIEELYELIA